MPLTRRLDILVVVATLALTGCEPDPLDEAGELWRSYRRDLAIESYREIVELDPENRAKRSLLAMRLLELAAQKILPANRDEQRPLCLEAAGIWEEVVEAEPENLDAHGWLGVAHFCAGESEAASRAFAEAQRIRYEVVRGSPSMVNYVEIDRRNFDLRVERRYLKPRAAELCGKAHSEEESGAPAFHRFQPRGQDTWVYLDRLGIRGKTTSDWLEQSWPEEISAAHWAAVRSLICIRTSPRRGGSYGAGGVGYHVDWEVRAVRWPSGEVLASELFECTRPLPETKGIGGDLYVAGPKESVVSWLLELAAEGDASISDTEESEIVPTVEGS